MTPVWMIEGGATTLDGDETTSELARASLAGTADLDNDPISDRNVAERRLAALAAAIRDHESRKRHTAVPARPEDLVLYRRLRQVCGQV
jgi:hypothetical protein